VYGVVHRNSTHDSTVWPGVQRRSLQVMAVLMSGYGLLLPYFLLPAAAD